MEFYWNFGFQISQFFLKKKIEVKETVLTEIQEGGELDFKIFFKN